MPDDVTRAPLVAVSPTPMHRLPRLAARLGMQADCLWVKRDDLTGLAAGGNKARKLDKLVADALASKCDHLVTGGGTQSNHARTTAAAASAYGLGCTLVLTGTPETPDGSGNVLLDRVLGADISWVGPLGFDDLEAAIAARGDELEAEGCRPYRIPVGGSSPLGASAYAEVADEIRAQAEPDLVVVASGSAGTHAGLVAGFGDHGRVLGVDVGARADIATAVPELAGAVAGLLGLPAPTGTVQVDRRQAGPGYGAPTEEAREALLLTARSDGIVLDPVYTAKAMAGLFAARRDGRIEPQTRVVFVHTGGLPGLFAHRYLDWATP